MKAVYIKELRSYFTGAVAYACIALMFVIAGIYTWALNIEGATGAFESTITNMAFWMCILPVPLLTMRIFAEERKQKTDQLLYSLPLKPTEIVLGKYFAAVTVLIIPVLVIAAYPLILSFYGSVNFLTCYSTLFGFLLMGCSLLAIGVFISSLGENQIVAAIGTAVVIFLNYFLPYFADYITTSSAAAAIFLIVIALIIGFITFLMTKNLTAGITVSAVLMFLLILTYFLSPDTLEGLLPNLMSSISVFDALETFAGGIFSISNIVYYLSISGVFLFLTVQSLEKRRWA